MKKIIDASFNQRERFTENGKKMDTHIEHLKYFEFLRHMLRKEGLGNFIRTD